jgi:hypothetical protein
MDHMELGLGKGSIMRLLKFGRLETFCRRRQYIGKYLVAFGVAAALMVLCMGWLVYDAAAQTNDVPNDGPLTVRECLSEAHISVGPVEQTLIQQGIIAWDLLPTKVTDGMCEEMLEQPADGTPVGRLVAAQNYVQDIKLIEYTIRRATGEAAAKGTDHHFLADKPLVLPRWTLLGVPGVEATQRGATARQIATAVVAEGNASIPEMLEKIEAAYFRERDSRPEAVAAAHCALETALLDAISKELSQRKYIKVSPDPTPKEMEYGKTVTIKLLVSGDVSGLYEKLEGQYEKVAEASAAEEGCVDFNARMKADLIDDDFSIDSHQGQEMRSITHDTTWSWDVTANAEGKNYVDLLVGHVLQRGETEVTPKWVLPSPVPRAVITVKVNSLGEASNLIGSNWHWLLPVAIALAAAATWLVWMLTKREHDR